MIIQSSSNAVSAYSSIRMPNVHRQTQATEPATVADTVSISDQAKQIAALNIPPGEYPMEYYSIPKWQADLMPVALSGKLGANVKSLYERGGDLVGKYDSELAEYGKLLDGHVQDVLKKEGISSTPEYHQAMIVDKDSSERIRQLTMDSIAGDKRMTQLMSVLGIQIPG